MTQTDAISLLSTEAIASAPPQVWADLGCGSGTFTEALANLLPRDSLVHAVDSSQAALHKVPQQVGQTSITTHQANFEQDSLPFQALDGILMANALHFVSDKAAFVQRAQQTLLKPHGQWLIVEYNHNRANPWVPYPIPFVDLQTLFIGLGYQQVSMIHEIPSRYGGNIYGAIIGQREA